MSDPHRIDSIDALRTIYRMPAEATVNKERPTIDARHAPVPRTVPLRGARHLRRRRQRRHLATRRRLRLRPRARRSATWRSPTWAATTGSTRCRTWSPRGRIALHLRGARPERDGAGERRGVAHDRPRGARPLPAAAVAEDRRSWSRSRPPTSTARRRSIRGGMWDPEVWAALADAPDGAAILSCQLSDGSAPTSCAPGSTTTTPQRSPRSAPRPDPRSGHRFRPSWPGADGRRASRKSSVLSHGASLPMSRARSLVISPASTA